jgi:hypothetical protein
MEVTIAGRKIHIISLCRALFDHVENMSPFHAYEVDEIFPYSGSPSVCPQPIESTSNDKVIETPYPSIPEALWPRTLVGNRSSSGSSPAPNTFSCILSTRALEA